MIPSSLGITLGKVIAAIAIMAAVSYATRAVTLVFLRKKIKNTFIRSVITYIPYGILASMVFPGILYSTASSAAQFPSPSVFLSTAAGAAVAVILSLFNRKLFTVSMASVATVLLLLYVLPLTGMP